jgi:putative membrane protein
MMHADQRFSSAVEAAVADLERKTDAEVVVVAAERSGSYDDVAQRAGAVIALVVLIAILTLPWPVHPLFAIADVVFAYLLGSWGAANHAWLARAVGETRRDEQVRLSASAEFHREAVHATPRRTGLLVYVSAWEKKVELIPDVGLEAKIPRGLWANAAQKLRADDLDHFIRGLTAVGDLLAEHVPHIDGQRVDLPNAPRVRV